MEADERADAVRRALESLGERDREVLLLRDAGLGYPEIAERTGLAVGAVGTTLCRARKRLVEAHALLNERPTGRRHMRHVDDGTIHAWLDEQITDPAEAAWIDEHLRGCGECRVRVAEERATFDRAQTLLAGAAPSGEQPSLESLVAKAVRDLQPVETPSDARLTRGGRDRVLILAGWAASLALAVGLGWTARELTDRDAVNQAPAPVIAGPSEVSVAPPAKPADVAQPPAAAPVTGAQASQQRAAAATRPAVPDTSVESAVPAQGREASAPVAETAQPAAPPVAAPPPPPPAAVQPREAALRQEAVTVTGVSAAPAAARVDTEWRTLPRTEAAARTGMPLYGIDGVEPLATALSADGAAVRTITGSRPARRWSSCSSGPPPMVSPTSRLRDAGSPGPEPAAMQPSSAGSRRRSGRCPPCAATCVLRCEPLPLGPTSTHWAQSCASTDYCSDSLPAEVTRFTVRRSASMQRCQLPAVRSTQVEQFVCPALTPSRN